MSGRKAITPRMKLDCLFYRHEVTCAICKGRILPGDRVDFDHIHAVTFNGPHTYDNLRPLHYECHKPKTRRDVKDKAKLDRITGETGQDKLKKPWPKGRKIQAPADPWNRKWKESRT